MKKLIILSVLSLLCTSLFFAQENDYSSITLKSKMGEISAYQDGKYLRFSQLNKLMQGNDQALRLINAAETNRVISCITGAAAGTLIVWPIANVITGEKPYWWMLGAGVGILAGTFSILRLSNKQIKKAVDIYNANRSTSSLTRNTELKLALSTNGIGLNIRF